MGFVFQFTYPEETGIAIQATTLMRAVLVYWSVFTTYQKTISVGIDSIVDNFSHTSIDPIVGQPNYKSLAEVHLNLNTNAASVRSHLGDGRLGLLYLTVTPAVYNTQSNIPFMPPTNLGPTLMIPNNAISHQINEINCQFNRATELYKEYNDTNKALKSFLISAVDDLYIRALKDKYIGYANVTTLQMLTHLYANYAKITLTNLEENDKRMKADWNPNQPFKVLIDQIDDGVDYATAGEKPYTPEQIVNIAYNLVY